ncbi:SGNH/GDSL hydrolase family protein [Mucilaginibacter sp. FT3.2]|uniref:SGNH/GDSL hydrolase family protein n=1 Tax=Mucilaginibacter sp. FT3.2 TaxID=2723090 RepID=UPI00160E3E9D|nr:SGNH/GDSL hydrolase family protein [Mucilaginibacter sp. FT3.2]MBB6233920.1 lysophospholipase L1-like esterase [Mucilaginibacter sp. FT3.2]
MKNYYYSFLLLCVFVMPAYAQTVQPFKQGDRVVFTGNSITDGGHYHSYIWLYYITHFPNRKITVFNAGIGGDVSRQMLERLDNDVFAKQPTVVTLTFGMNDTGYQNLKGAKADSTYAAKIGESLKSFRLIEEKLKQHPAVRKVMIASSPYDETSKIKTTPLMGKNAAMLKIAADQQSTAASNHWDFVDFNHPMTAINLQQQQTDSVFTMQNADRIHPTNDGQMVMAYLFLKAQGLAGKKVAGVVINVNNKKVALAENCTITAPVININHIKFNYLANSLPYPLDTIAGGFGRPAKPQSAVIKLVPFTDEFNQELLQVKGLKASAQYTLKIDGQPMGSWGGDDYAKGINMALLTNTPQYQQALAIMHLNEERWTIERRLREYYWMHYSILKPKGLLFNDGPATLDSLSKYAKKDFFVAVTLPTYQKARFKSVRDAWQKEMDLLTSQIYRINKPLNHLIEITPDQ